MTPTVARSTLGAVQRHHSDRPDLIAQARRNLAAAKLEDYIKRVVDAAPPLTVEQRSRLTVLLAGVS